MYCITSVAVSMPTTRFLVGHHGQCPDVPLVHHASRLTYVHLGPDGERADRHDVADLDALQYAGD
jgi:hypothetical protein